MVVETDPTRGLGAEKKGRAMLSCETRHATIPCGPKHAIPLIGILYNGLPMALTDGVGGFLRACRWAAAAWAWGTRRAFGPRPFR
jgi:hypothetical protein